MLTLSDTAYNIAKKIAQIWLPALGSLYFSLAAIWDLPNADQVVGSIVVIDTFLGVVLGISTKVYNDSDAPYDGQMVVSEDSGKKTFNLNLDSDPAELEGKDKVVFKVVPNSFWAGKP
jgi:Putative phage holin Dp-1